MDQLKDTFYALTSCFCKQDATLKLNGRSFKILKLLGEGGFSYVYLAQDLTSTRLFALKKIRCPVSSSTGVGGDGHGTDPSSSSSSSLRQALKEVEAYKKFRHPNIIRCLDSCVVQDPDDLDGSKIIYLFLPYYQKGTCQDVIAMNAVNGTRSTELETLKWFLGTCEAVRVMHTYKPTTGQSSTSLNSMMTAGSSIKKGGKEKKQQQRRKIKGSYPPPRGMNIDDDESDYLEEEEEEGLEEEELEEGILNNEEGGEEEEEGRALIGGVEALKEAMNEQDDPLLSLNQNKTTCDDRTTINNKGKGGREGIEPWAHRDIKPANIMLTDDSQPILMDFGSALPAYIPIPDRRTALFQQDLAAEHCSMPFRAPELFDVKTNEPLTEKVDIWSLGTTLFAMAYGTSPFETIQQSEHGGSIAMAVMNGKFQFPKESLTRHSQGFRDLVEGLLKVDPKERPDIHQVITATKAVIARLN